MAQVISSSMAKSYTAPMSQTFPIQGIKAFNRYSLVGAGLLGIFLMYFFIPHVGVFDVIFSPSIFYLIIIPSISLVFALVALRQMKYGLQKGKTLSYVTLGITTLYFMVVLAIPFVLFLMYIMYTFFL